MSDPQIRPLPLDAAGNLNWERIAKHETVTMSVDTEKQWLEMTCEVGGFTRRYAGTFTGRISIQPPKS